VSRFRASHVLILAGLLWLCAEQSFASTTDLRFERLRKEGDEFRASCYAILQSRAGFLYFGTSSGLFRYDGYTLREIKEPFEQAGLSGAFWVTAIEEGALGELWITSQPYGLLRLDPALSNAQQVGKVSEARAAPRTILSPQCLAIDRHGKILYGGSFGLRRVDPDSGTVEDLGYLWDEEGFGEAPLCADLAVDPRGGILVATGRGTYRITSEDFRDRTTISRISDQPSMSILLGSDGSLWIGTSREDVIRIDKEGRERLYPLRTSHQTGEVHNRAVWSLLEDGSGTVWAGTMLSGLHRFDATRDSFERVEQDGLTEIRSMTVDGSDVLWIGTRLGAIKAVGRRQGFATMSHNPNDGESLPHSDVHGIVQLSNGNVWVATSAGLARVDLHTLKAKRHGGRFGYLTSLVADKKENLWSSAYGAGVVRVSPKDGSARIHRHDPADTTTISSDFVSSLFVSSRAVLYVGSSFGVDAMSSTDGVFRRLRLETDDRGNPRKNGVMSFCEDVAGRIWCATFRGGVLVYDPATGSVERHTNDPSDNRTLASDQVFTVAYDGRTVWAGTSAGLSRFDPARGGWDPVPGDGTLRGKPIYGILFSGGTELWVSSEDGLFRIRLNAEGEYISTFFGPVHGVPAGAYEPESAFHTREGRMLFGGVNGLVFFLPDEVSTPRAPPSVVLTGVKTVEGPVPAFESLGKAELSYDDPYVTFEFAVLDYADPERNEYAYRLDGFDEDWIQAGTRRYVTYTNLDPGDYVLHVRGASALGVWNESGVTVPIRVAPPFWGTWWFRILAGATVLAIGIVVYRYRVNRLLELERIRIRIASDLHDEVGSTLTKVALYSDLLREGSRAQAQGGIIDKIGDLSREAISTMSDIVWSIDARNDSVGEMLIRMKDTAEGLLGPKNIEFEFVESGLDSAMKLSPTVRENLYLIMKEAVHNATKHSSATKVRVRMEGQGKGLQMTIEDNGRGIDPESARKGNGLRNMAMRAERIDASLTMTGPPGTTVAIRKPSL